MRKFDEFMEANFSMDDRDDRFIASIILARWIEKIADSLLAEGDLDPACVLEVYESTQYLIGQFEEANSRKTLQRARERLDPEGSAVV